MEKQRKIYLNEKWYEFSAKVKNRDRNRCLRCDRAPPDVVLQVHHERYITGKKPWEYALSDCRTLCKGCHAREHKLIEPDKGWTLIAIDDLGGLDGVCERKNCGAGIRYANSTYHPDWGYKVVGSTCVEHLTQEDRLLSGELIKSYKQISEFVHGTTWQAGFTKNKRKYISCQYSHHTIRIYGDTHNYAYQLIIKIKGKRWHNYKEIKKLPNKSLEEVKELSYIVLKGTISESEKEKNLLRGIYKRIIQKNT